MIKQPSAIDTLIANYPTLDKCRQSIEQSVDILHRSFSTAKKLLLCGNGGSAADCDHISAECLKGFKRSRPLEAKWHVQLGEKLASNLQGALPALPLSQFTALLTAFSNDCAAEYAYAQLVWALGEAGDTLLCISTSGNSVNILNAAATAKGKLLHTIGLTGQSGGKLKAIVEHCICVPEAETYRVQELHLPIYHALCIELEERFF